MVLDTSAIVAVIASEPDAIQYRSAMLGATSLAMSAVAVLESKIVLRSRHGEAAVIVPFGAPMAELAFDAFRRYGKGQEHPTRLNIIDCAVYALAKMRGESLLFKGSDFEKTDVQAAV
jgi:ribonuclease VapC